VSEFETGLNKVYQILSVPIAEFKSKFERLDVDLQTFTAPITELK